MKVLLHFPISMCTHSKVSVFFVAHRYFSLLLLGCVFEIWCGSYASQTDDRACLACFAVQGYHSKSTYTWLLNDQLLTETTPLLYTSQEGIYRCEVKADGEQLFGVFKLGRKWIFLCFSPRISIKPSQDPGMAF